VGLWRCPAPEFRKKFGKKRKETAYKYYHKKFTDA